MTQSTLYLQCPMGASGDMLVSSLASLFPDHENIEKELQELGVPGVEVALEHSSSLGMEGLHAAVRIHGMEEDACHGEHCGHHHHASLTDILRLIDSLHMPSEPKEDAKAVYSRIAQAEAAVHGTQPGEVHFHEVGMLDAVFDVSAVCFLIHRLSPSHIVCSPVCVGSGLVYCAHGFLPVPAPATARLLEGIPVYGSKFPGELCTPTGAALLSYFANEFGPMPQMTPQRFGCGVGSRTFPQPNVLRCILGKSGATEPSAFKRDSVLKLEANIDDMTAEDLAFALEALIEAGALDAWTTPIVMKKGRPACMLTCLCQCNQGELFRNLVFKHTTTLGIRETETGRSLLSRRIETRRTTAGIIRVKIAEGPGICREKAEFDDLKAAAKECGSSIEEIRRLVREPLD